MANDVATAKRPGWRAHLWILGGGLALAIPITIVDMLLLGPSHGGWISLDFRGLLIGAYAGFWVIEALLSTLVVALFRGRSVAIGVLAHGAAIGLIALAAIVWATLDDRAAAVQEEATLADRAQTWRSAERALRVISWHRVPDSEIAAVEVSFMARAAGQLGAAYTRQPDALVSPSPARGMRTGDVVTMTLEVDPYASGGDGDYIFVEWRTGGWSVPIRFCRPACEIDPLEPDAILRELPASR